MCGPCFGGGWSASDGRPSPGALPSRGLEFLGARRSRGKRCLLSSRRERLDLEAASTTRGHDKVATNWLCVEAPTVLEGGLETTAMMREALASGSGDVVIDMRATELLTSLGCHALVDLHCALERDGRRLLLQGPNAVVQTVLRITGLDDRLLVLPPADER